MFLKYYFKFLLQNKKNFIIVALVIYSVNRWSNTFVHCVYIISKYEKFTKSDLIKFQVYITFIIIFILLYKKKVS